MDFSFSEMLFLAVLALLVFGPRRLPEIARRLGRLAAEIKRAGAEFRTQLEAETGEGEIAKQRDYYRSRAEELSKQIQDGFSAPSPRAAEPTVYESPYPETAPTPAPESNAAVGPHALHAAPDDAAKPAESPKTPDDPTRAADA